MNKENTLVALLLDYDSCWSPTHHGQQPKDRSLIDVNHDMIEHFKALLHEENARKCVLASFSQRQTYKGDIRNSGHKNNPLSFGVFSELAWKLPELIIPSNCEFYYDSYLTRDTFGPALLELEQQKNKSICSPLLSLFFSSCNRSKKSKSAMLNEYKTVFDRSKVLISVALINKIANENPGYKIIINIYDDMHGDDIAFDILEAQYSFFSKHTELIPANAVLHFYHRVNDGQEKFIKKLAHTVTGTQQLKIDFEQTILNLAKHATQAEYGHSNPTMHHELLVNVAEQVPHKQLSNFEKI